MALTEEPKWYQEVLKEMTRAPEEPQLEPFSIRHATEAQEEAIRGLADQAGFKDLRGFWAWVKSADLDYYDLIRIASPE